LQENLLTSEQYIRYKKINGSETMTGLLGTNALLQIDINLILQIVMFLIITIGYYYKRQRKYKIHGSMMGIAVILHVISFLTVMGPSFSTNYDYLTMVFSDLVVQTIWIHAIPGAIALILGIVLVGAWALSPSNIAACIKRKRIMDVTITLWFISLTFGIATYIIGYL
jgi:uncharacterized membrane protein YozB (DUF420 family)